MTNVQFKSEGDDLFINGKKVIKAWESFSGWYWFATEKAHTQDSIINDRVVENDQIWHGLVQGLEEEWGYFSQAELESMKHGVWRIPKINLLFSGRRQ